MFACELPSSLFYVNEASTPISDFNGSSSTPHTDTAAPATVAMHLLPVVE
jgi:hypothetical protein